VPGIPFSPSLGHTFTTLSYPWTTSHRYTSPAQKRRQGITEGLVRLSVGSKIWARSKQPLATGCEDKRFRARQFIPAFGRMI
jgi:Cys/Met metabolism PLP-dependent enzyme